MSYRYGVLLVLVALPLLLSSQLPVYSVYQVSVSGHFGSANYGPIVLPISANFNRNSVQVSLNLTGLTGNVNLVLYNASEVLYNASGAKVQPGGPIISKTKAELYSNKTFIGGKYYQAITLTKEDGAGNLTAVLYPINGAKGVASIIASYYTLPPSPAALPVSLTIIGIGIVWIAASVLTPRRTKK